MTEKLKIPDISSRPLVSAIIPAYNAETTIGETLRSVLRQTYKNLEAIVVDDGSTDGTIEIVRSMAAWDNRLRLLRQENAGVAAARNRGIEASRGEFIAPIDADDIWFSRNLEKQVARMMRIDDPVDVVYSWTLEIDRDGQFSGGFHSARFEGSVFFALLQAFFIGHASGTLIRKKCFEKIGGYDSGLRDQNAEGCEDWDFCLRMAEHYRFGVVPKFLIAYRLVPGNMSSHLETIAASYDLVLARLRVRRPHIPKTWHRWSKANFRMYLALRSRENGRLKDAMGFMLEALKLDTPGTLLRHDLYTIITLCLLNAVSKGPIISEAAPSAIARRVKAQGLLPIKRLQRFRLRHIRGLCQINGFGKMRKP